MRGFGDGPSSYGLGNRGLRREPGDIVSPQPAFVNPLRGTGEDVAPRFVQLSDAERTMPAVEIFPSRDLRRTGSTELEAGGERVDRYAQRGRPFPRLGEYGEVVQASDGFRQSREAIARLKGRFDLKGRLGRAPEAVVASLNDDQPGDEANQVPREHQEVQDESPAIREAPPPMPPRRGGGAIEGAAGDDESHRLLVEANIHAEFIHTHEITTVNSKGTFPFISARESAPLTEIEFTTYSFQGGPPIYDIGLNFDDHDHMQAIGRIRIDSDGTVRESGDLSLLFGTEEDPANSPPYTIQGKGLEPELDWLQGDEFRTEAGLDVISDRVAIEALHRLKEGLGETWPKAVVLPEASGGDAIAIQSTAGLFRSVANALANQKVSKHSIWSGRDVTYSVATTVENGNPANVTITKVNHIYEEDAVVRNESEELKLSADGSPKYAALTYYDTSEVLRHEDRERREELWEAQNRFAERYRQLEAEGYPEATQAQIQEGLAILARKGTNIETKAIFDASAAETEIEVPTEIGLNEKIAFSSEVSRLIRTPKKLGPLLPDVYTRYNKNDISVYLSMPEMGSQPDEADWIVAETTQFLYKTDQHHRVFRVIELKFYPNLGDEGSFGYNEHELILDAEGNRVRPKLNIPDFDDLAYEAYARAQSQAIFDRVASERELGLLDVTPQRYYDMMSFLRSLQPEDEVS